MKKVLILLLTICVAAAFTACGSKSDTGSDTGTGAADTEATAGDTTEAPTEAASDTVTTDVSERYFGISLPLTSSEYYKGVQDNLTAVCKEYGIKYSIASADNDVAKQISQVENFINMGVDTIIVYPLDNEGLSDIMKSAKATGIRVLSATTAPSDTEAYDICVDADQAVVGDAGAKYLADWVEKTYPDAADGSVEVCIFGMWHSDNSGKRCDAFANVEKYSSKVKIVDTYEIGMTDFLGDTQKYAELMMQEHPDVKGIITYSDTFNIIINEVMMSTPGFDASEVCSVAIDKTDAVMAQIKLSETNESTIRATVASGKDFNRTLIDTALGNYDDQLDAQKKYFVDAYVIDATNVDEAMATK